MENVERRLTALQELPGRVDALTLQISQLRTEMRVLNDETRAEMRVLHEDVVARISLLGEALPRRRAVRRKKR